MLTKLKSKHRLRLIMFISVVLGVSVLTVSAVLLAKIRSSRNQQNKPRPTSNVSPSYAPHHGKSDQSPYPSESGRITDIKAMNKRLLQASGTIFTTTSLPAQPHGIPDNLDAIEQINKKTAARDSNRKNPTSKYSRAKSPPHVSNKLNNIKDSKDLPTLEQLLEGRKKRSVQTDSGSSDSDLFKSGICLDERRRFTGLSITGIVFSIFQFLFSILSCWAVAKKMDIINLMRIWWFTNMIQGISFVLILGLSLYSNHCESANYTSERRVFSSFVGLNSIILFGFVIYSHFQVIKNQSAEDDVDNCCLVDTTLT